MPKRNLKPASDPSNPAMPPPQDPYPVPLGAPFGETSSLAPQPQAVFQAMPPQPTQHLPPPPPSPSSGRKRKAPGAATTPTLASSVPNAPGDGSEILSSPPTAKKSRTNTPWSPAEEQRLKNMRDAGSSWSEIAKTFPTRTEGSVKKHWYKDMHYAEFAEDESAALLAAIKDYEASKWKVIGQKVGKPAKACEQYAKEHFGNKT